MYDKRKNTRRNRSNTFSIALALACTHAAFAQSGDANTLTSDTEIATAGYFQLRWEAAEPIRLVESTTADFDDSHTVYEGSDSGHTVSGRADGTLFYRLESAATGEVLAQPLRVVVAHHPIARAFTFFGVGAFVFLATALLILIGNRTADSSGERPARSAH